MKINSYSFGEMAVLGKKYDKDLIVFPDRILSGWWRKEGHLLEVSDLEEVIKYKPEVLIVGRGASGCMNIPASTIDALDKINIKVISDNTDKAVKIFNEQMSVGKRIVGAFHLTC